MLSDEEIRNKILQFEQEKQPYYEAGTKHPEWAPLFHALRSQPVEKLESILQTGYILPGKKVNPIFKSYTGDTLFIRLNNDNDFVNANHGDYISVMAYEPDAFEFRTFIEANLYFVLRGDIPARETFYLTLGEYDWLLISGMPVENLYSFAHYEYFVDKPISVDKILGLEFCSKKVRLSRKTVEIFITRVTDILKYYNADFEFRDFSTGEVYYSGKKRSRS